MADQLELLTVPVLRPEKPIYPETFALFPIFAPVKDRTELDTTWGKNGTQYIYNFAWGEMQRFGPGLNTYDEDTLIALFQLATLHRHEGLPTHFPIPFPGEHSVVYSGDVTPYQVNVWLGRDVGGADLQLTWESIERLSLTQLRVLTNEGMHENLKFFWHRASNARDASKTRILLQFPPAIVELLQRIVTVDMDIRKGLTLVGKSVYRYFLALKKSDPTLYTILLTDLQACIDYRGKLTELKTALNGRTGRVGVLLQLQTAGVIGQCEFTGRGKTSQLVVEIL